MINRKYIKYIAPAIAFGVILTTNIQYINIPVCAEVTEATFKETVVDGDVNTWRQDIPHDYEGISSYLSSKNCNYGNNPVFNNNRIWSTEGSATSIGLDTNMGNSGGLLFALAKLINYSGVDTTLNPGSLYFYSYYAQNSSGKYYMPYENNGNVSHDYSCWVDFLSDCYKDITFEGRTTLSVGSSSTNAEDKLNILRSAMDDGKYVIVEIKSNAVKYYDWTSNSIEKGLPHNHFVLLTGYDSNKNIGMDDSLTSADTLIDVYSAEDIVAYNTFVVSGNHRSTLPFYSKSVEIPWNLILVNKENGVTKEYIEAVQTATTDLKTNSGRAGGNSYDRDEVDSRIVSDMNSMVAAFKSECSKDLYGQSGMRSYSYQESLFNGYVASQGQAHADMYSARPGKSEHNIGLAMDFGALLPSGGYVSTNENFENTSAYDWMCKNAYKYGFILRYPKGDEAVAKTGYGYEPWHWRYIGAEYAKKFVEYVGGDTSDPDHIYAYANSGYNNKTYEDFYVDIVVPDYSVDDTKTEKNSTSNSDSAEVDMTKYSDETPRRLYYFLRHPVKSLGNLFIGISQRVYNQAAVGPQASLSNANWLITILKKYDILRWYIIISSCISAIGIVLYLVKMAFNKNLNWRNSSKGLLYSMLGTIAPMLVIVGMTSVLNKISNKMLSVYEERLLVTELGTNIVELSSGELEEEKEKSEPKIITVMKEEEAVQEESNTAISSAERIADGELLTPTACKYQDLRKWYPLTAQDIEDVIAKKSPSCYWKGKGWIFIQAGRVSGIDPRFIFALCIAEAGWNPINRHLSKHNFFSINMPDNNLEAGYDFGSSDEEGIINSMLWLSEKYIFNEERKQYTIQEMAFPTEAAAQGHSYNNTAHWSSDTQSGSVPCLMAYFPVKSNYDTANVFNTGQSSNFTGSGKYAGKSYQSTTPDGNSNATAGTGSSETNTKKKKTYVSNGEYQLWLDDKLEKDIFKESSPGSYVSLDISFQVGDELKTMDIKTLLALTDDDLKNFNFSVINENENDVYDRFFGDIPYTKEDVKDFAEGFKYNNYLYYCKEQFIPVHYNLYKESVFWYFYDYIKYQYIRYNATVNPNSMLSNYSLPKGDFNPEDFVEIYSGVYNDAFPEPEEETSEQYMKRLKALEDVIKMSSTEYISMMCNYNYTHYNNSVNDLIGLSNLFNFTEYSDIDGYYPGFSNLYFNAHDINAWAKAQEYNYRVMLPDFDDFSGKFYNVPVISGFVQGSNWNKYTDVLAKGDPDRISNYYFSGEAIKSSEMLTSPIPVTNGGRIPWRVYATKGRLDKIGEEATKFERKLIELNNNVYRRVEYLTRCSYGELNDNQLIFLNALIATEEFNKMFSKDAEPRCVTIDSVDIDKIIRLTYAKSLSDISKNPDTLYMVYEEHGFINAFLLTLSAVFLVVNNMCRVFLLGLIFIMVGINVLGFAFFGKETRIDALKGAAIQSFGLIFNFVAILGILSINLVLQDIATVGLVSIIFTLIITLLIVIVTVLNIALTRAMCKDAVNYGGGFITKWYASTSSRFMATTATVRSEITKMKSGFASGNLLDKIEDNARDIQERKRMRNVNVFNIENVTKEAISLDDL